MAEDRKDEAKAPHWTSGQLTEAASHPHSPEIKEQSGAGAGLVRSANGFPYQEGEEPGLGSREQPGTYAHSKENGINGELSAGDRETAGNVPRCSAAEPGLCCPWEDICWARAEKLLRAGSRKPLSCRALTAPCSRVCTCTKDGLCCYCSQVITPSVHPQSMCRITHRSA